MVQLSAVNATEEVRPLPDVIYDSLRERILVGQLVPGTEIRQELLAREFGTSRVPIREALSRLQAERLITLRPRRGFAVTLLSQSEIVEIFELRMAVEEHAMRIATNARTENDLREIEMLIQRMETLDPAVPQYLQDWMSTNRLFHNRLIECGHRKRVAEIALNLRDVIEPYIRIEANFNGQVSYANVEHRQIFEAFKKKDAALAARRSRKHCESTLKRLLGNIDLLHEDPFADRMKSQRSGKSG
jgi:DNA-binding GntR family transcriptional regulator